MHRHSAPTKSPNGARPRPQNRAAGEHTCPADAWARLPPRSLPHMRAAPAVAHSADEPLRTIQVARSIFPSPATCRDHASTPLRARVPNGDIFLGAVLEHEANRMVRARWPFAVMHEGGGRSSPARRSSATGGRAIRALASCRRRCRPAAPRWPSRTPLRCLCRLAAPHMPSHIVLRGRGWRLEERRGRSGRGPRTSRGAGNDATARARPRA